MVFINDRAAKATNRPRKQSSILENDRSSSFTIKHYSKTTDYLRSRSISKGCPITCSVLVNYRSTPKMIEHPRARSSVSTALNRIFAINHRTQAESKTSATCSAALAIGAEDTLLSRLLSAATGAAIVEVVIDCTVDVMASSIEQFQDKVCMKAES
uniref:SFRICE_000238 n=1 Tax=Spodoptera frugiperda TaxID=7108 RepID=A0A2H1VMZ4_SPOFR